MEIGNDMDCNLCAINVIYAMAKRLVIFHIYFDDDIWATL